ncbi:anthrone oxygenase family protein [Micromonospora sp. H33]|uniref:anthrone oxygenase family protein n=1 Tax=Micromonospora sp. H33 TaxID=3452215 RepID=UPI003F8C554B
MSAVTEALHVLVLLGSGTVAGVLFAVALSTVPALAAMTPDRYVQAHTLLGRNWDPTMPLIVLGTTLLDLWLAFRTTASTPRALIVVAAVCLLGVSVVSHFRNVPINRRVHRTDPAAIPTDWADPRPVWRRWHLLRTALALVAFTANSLAVTAF